MFLVLVKMMDKLVMVLFWIALHTGFVVSGIKPVETLVLSLNT